MKAITIPEFGDEDALVLAEVADPRPGPDEVVLAVAAAGVNRADLLQRQGFYSPPEGESELPGLEVSGTIAAVGPEVRDWKVGDQACALLSGGGYAEQVAVPQGQLLPVPAGIDLIDAAALPEVTATVWSNLFEVARLRAGERLLVHGGSSGIGTMAIQIATALGVTVAVTAGSAAKLYACRELGAEILINYRDEDFLERIMAETEGDGVEVILDVVGAKYLARNVAALAAGGRLVVIGMQGGTKGELDLGALLAKGGSVQATSLRNRPRAQKAQIVAGVREHVWPLVERGAVRPIVHARLPLAQAAQAHRVLAESSHTGKVLLIV